MNYNVQNLEVIRHLRNHGDVVNTIVIVRSASGLEPGV